MSARPVGHADLKVSASQQRTAPSSETRAHRVSRTAGTSSAPAASDQRLRRYRTFPPAPATSATSGPGNGARIGSTNSSDQDVVAERRVKGRRRPRRDGRARLMTPVSKSNGGQTIKKPGPDLRIPTAQAPVSPCMPTQITGLQVRQRGAGEVSRSAPRRPSGWKDILEHGHGLRK